MIIAFRDIVAQMGETNVVEAAAGGIQTALLTTCFGLIVGIPAFIAYNYFTSVINRYVLDVDPLENAGATKVVAEEFESTLVLVGETLQRFGVPEESVARFAAELRVVTFAKDPPEALEKFQRFARAAIQGDKVDIDLAAEPAETMVGRQGRIYSSGAYVVMAATGMVAAIVIPAFAKYQEKARAASGESPQ